MKTIARTLLIVLALVSLTTLTGCSMTDAKNRATNAWSTMTADQADSAIMKAHKSIYNCILNAEDAKADALAEEAIIYTQCAYTKYFMCDKVGADGSKAFIALAKKFLPKGDAEARTAWSSLKETGALVELKLIAHGKHELQRKLAAEKKLAAKKQ